MEPSFAQDYGGWQQWHWWFRGRRRIVEEVLRRELMPSAALRIASIGCGPATELQWLQGFAGLRNYVIGVDPDIGHALPRAEHVDFVQAQAEDPPLRPGCFDVVLMLDVLEHLDDDARGLREACRLLKTGGLLVATVPALPSLWGRQDVVSHHRRRYTKFALEDCFARAGLEQPELAYLNTLLFPAIAAARWSRRALGDDATTKSDFQNSRPGPLNDLLGWTFGLERHWIYRLPMPVGVSLLAKLKLDVPTQRRMSSRR